MSERKPSSSGESLSEYARVLDDKVGLHYLAQKIRKRTGGTLEEKHEIMEKLGLPLEPSVWVSIKDFLADPDKYFSELSEKLGGHEPKEFFAGLVPGKTRVFGVPREKVVEFIREQRSNFPDDFEFKLSSRDHAFAGSFDVNEKGELLGVFVLGPYEWLAHGKSSGDLFFSEEKFIGSPRFEFVGAMGGGEFDDFRNDLTKYKTYTDSEITKQQMAKNVLAAREYLRRAVGTERGKYAPGHYRVKFVDSEHGFRPYFMKAILE